MGSPFEILITRQGWLGENDPDLDYDAAPVDLCSHGGIRLAIGGQVIAPGGDDDEYGISETALALLRTPESDHSSERRVAERLIFHGCGLILMMGRPVGIDWSASHVDDQVRIDDVVRYDTVDETEAVRFPGVAAEVSEGEYRLHVVAFSERAKEPFEGIAKEFADDFEQQQYEEFWEEFDARLTRAVGNPSGGHGEVVAWLKHTSGTVLSRSRHTFGSDPKGCPFRTGNPCRVCDEVATRVRHVTGPARSCLTGVTFSGLTPTDAGLGRGLRSGSVTKGSNESLHFDRERGNSAGRPGSDVFALELERRKMYRLAPSRRERWQGPGSRGRSSRTP